jgi:hypothetical protein
MAVSEEYLHILKVCGVRGREKGLFDSEERRERQAELEVTSVRRSGCDELSRTCEITAAEKCDGRLPYAMDKVFRKAHNRSLCNTNGLIDLESLTSARSVKERTKNKGNVLRLSRQRLWPSRVQQAASIRRLRHTFLDLEVDDCFRVLAL